MGQLKVQLINSFLGAKLLEVADPIDINALTKTLKRSSEGGGVIFEVIIDLEFIKGGRDYVKYAHENYGGIDAEVFVNIYEYDSNNRKWNLWAAGKINYQRYKVTETKIIVIIEQKGIARKVLNLMETQVDLETDESENGTALTPIVPLDINFHSKRILRQSHAESTTHADPNTELYFENVDPGTFYIIYGLDQEELTEVEEQYNYITHFSTIDPVEILKYRNKFTEAGQYTLNVDAFYRFNTAGIPRDFSVDWFVKHGPQDNLTVQQIGTTHADNTNNLTGSQILDDYVFDVEIGDVLYIYGVLTFSGPNLAIYPGTSPFRVELNGATTFEETSVKTIMLHEAFEKVIQHYTNLTNCFYSELLGRTDLGYAEDGEAGLIGWTNGWRLRADNTKSIFASFDELFKFVNARFCIGYGFETVDENGCLIGTGDTGFTPGTQVMRVEKLEHFYDKNTRILSLGKVYNVEKELIPTLYYNRVLHGYTEKIDIEQINAIDEFCTKRETRIPVTNTKNKLDITCDTITGGYQIESQRRLTYSTEDGSLDDKNFAVTMVRDAGEASGFRTRKGSDGYVLASFENIYDPETGYNYYLSPGRCRIAWEKYIASGLIRSLTKILKFSKGEVNYLLKSQDDLEASVVEENGNSDLTNVEALFDPELYRFGTVPFTSTQMQLIEENPYGYIEFEDQFDEVMEGFLYSGKGIEIDPNAGTAEFELLKVHRQ